MSEPPPSSSGGGVPSSAQAAGDRQAPLENSPWQPGYLRMLSDASLEGLKNHTLHLPWETGVSREVFGKIRRVPEFVKHPYPPIAPPAVLDSGADAATSVRGLAPSGRDLPLLQHQPIYMSAIKLSSELKPSRRTSDVCIFKRWVCLLAHNWQGSESGKWLCQAGASETESGMRTILGGKSRATLDKRARRTSHMLAFASRRKCFLFPLTEEVVIPYLTELDKAGKRSAVLDATQTMNFLIHVLGVLAKFEISRHPWVKGLIRKCEQERPPLKQSRVLTAKEVLALETLFIEGDLQLIDRYALGCFLFLIFAISRVSDVSFLDTMTLDIQEGLDETSNPGYLEASTMHHKTQHVKSKQGIPLHLVAPVRGLHRVAWGPIFFKLCVEHRRGFVSGHTSCLLPGVTDAGVWASDRIKTSEAGAWLNKFLECALGGPPEPGLTSHGMKATLLSWCMKSGCDDLTLKVLGHHSRPGQRTTECYGRDAMSAPLRTLVSIVQAVSRGRFNPDATRSGHMVSPVSLAAPMRDDPIPAVPAGPHARADEPWEDVAPDSEAPDHGSEACTPEHQGAYGSAGIDLDAAASEDDVSDDESVSDEEPPAPRGNDARANGVAPPLDWNEKGEVFENPRTRKLHIKLKGCSSMACGRPEKGLLAFRGRIFENSDKCQQCSAAKPIRSTAAMIEFLDERLSRRGEPSH